VFRADAAGNWRVLHKFAGHAAGGNPWAGVIRDSAANMYGTAGIVVYRVDAAGHEKVLYTFKGGTDGADPIAGVIADAAGNLYGTTQRGGDGPCDCGVVHELDTAGMETVLHTFTGGAGGAEPTAGVIRDAAGNPYGTTGLGGTANVRVVYKVDASGQETILHSFTGGADGAEPTSLTSDSAGNLYGATWSGGANAGVVFKLDASGKGLLNTAAWRTMA
jgi:uncharacterized repeat protein (TIGR03803 family)